MSVELPKSKFDMDTARRLALLPPAVLAPHVPVLLTWLQDINWPVARPVCDALAGCGEALVEPLRQVLLSNDESWKLRQPLENGLKRQTWRRGMCSDRPPDATV